MLRRGPPFLPFAAGAKSNCRLTHSLRDKTAIDAYMPNVRYREKMAQHTRSVSIPNANLGARDVSPESEVGQCGEDCDFYPLKRLTA